MLSTPTVDATRCPLCGDANACAMETERLTGVPQGACWCMTAHFDAAVLERVPTASRGVACICARCASAAAQRDLNPLREG